MHDPDRIGDGTVDEAGADERDRQQRDADDERHAATDPSDPHRTDPPDLSDDWVVPA